jgi:aminoglycoside 6'-N-acetyltransferase I
MTVKIRRITSEDAALFDRIAADVFDEAIDPRRLAAYLARPGNLMVLALKHGEIVGQCAGVVHTHPDKPDELYIDEVGTGSAHRRQGIATAMLTELLAWGSELGCEDAWLGTERDNHAANALYRAFKGEEDTTKYYEFKL